jgi:hypothetical protein
MLTPSESSDFQRGYFQLNQSMENNEQLVRWDLSTILSISLQKDPTMDVLINDSKEVTLLSTRNNHWCDPYWDACKFDEPHTIPRCWDTSSLY